jgi:hypothetical protein
MNRPHDSLVILKVKLGKRAFDDEEAALPADVPEDLVRAILAARRSA